MANELKIEYRGRHIPYARIWNKNGLVWHTGLHSFVTFHTSAVGSYKVNLSNTSTSFWFFGDLPTRVPRIDYIAVYYRPLAADSAPSEDDYLLGTEDRSVVYKLEQITEQINELRTNLPQEVSDYLRTYVNEFKATTVDLVADAVANVTNSVVSNISLDLSTVENQLSYINASVVNIESTLNTSIITLVNNSEYLVNTQSNIHTNVAIITHEILNGNLVANVVIGVEAINANLKADLSNVSTFDSYQDQVNIGNVNSITVLNITDFHANITNLSTFDHLTHSVDIGSVNNEVVTIESFHTDISNLVSNITSSLEPEIANVDVIAHLLSSTVPTTIADPITRVLNVQLGVSPPLKDIINITKDSLFELTLKIADKQTNNRINLYTYDIEVPFLRNTNSINIPTPSINKYGGATGEMKINMNFTGIPTGTYIYHVYLTHVSTHRRYCILEGIVKIINT